MIAVQGPQAISVVAPLVSGLDVAALRPFAYGWGASIAGAEHVVVSRTGYTGEDGVELYVDAAHAGAVWDALLDAGRAVDMLPCGLGARDTLRLEAGLPLHGHELGPGITPLQAGLGWVVRWDKGDFRGRAPLEAERERGVHRRLRGLLTEGRQIARAGCGVAIDGETVGEVTSGNFSPVLERGIALAFLPPDVTDGTAVTIDVRGRGVEATVVPTPFIRQPFVKH